MNNMKFVVALLFLTGCFAEQYDTIDFIYRTDLQALNRQCKPLEDSHAKYGYFEDKQMSDWCTTQYQLVIREHEAAIRAFSHAP